MAWLSVTFLLFLEHYRHRLYLLVLFLMGGLISLSGCGGANASANNVGSAPSTTPSTPGTPTGTQTITVSATDSNGKLTHSVTLQVSLFSNWVQ
jgi:hypothetical protein